MCVKLLKQGICVHPMIKVDVLNSNNNYSPSFSAALAMKTSVLRYNPATRTYKPFAADLIKFDKKNPEDYESMKQICGLSDFQTLGSYLLKLWTNNTWNWPAVKSNSVYALTTPQKNYDIINTDDVLGITEFVENKEDIPGFYNQIMFMITRKPYQASNRSGLSNYSEIGTGMVDALKDLYPQKSIAVFSEIEALPFWEKQGFSTVGDRKLIYYV